MMHKILLAVAILFSIISFSEISPVINEKLVDDKYVNSSYNKDMDLFIIKSKIIVGECIDSKLISKELVDIDGRIYVKLIYDISEQHVYTNAKLVEKKEITIFHPLYIDDNKFALPNIGEYLKLSIILNEKKNKIEYKTIRKIDTDDTLDNEIYKEFNEVVTKSLESFLGNLKNNEKESNGLLKYFPYIEFDDMGYAYIKGTKKRLTSQENPIITYDSENNNSFVEYVDFIDGRFIPQILKIKKGKELNLEDLATKNGVEYIKNKLGEEIKFGIKYVNEEIIAKITFKDGKMVNIEIMP